MTNIKLKCGGINLNTIKKSRQKAALSVSKCILTGHV